MANITKGSRGVGATPAAAGGGRQVPTFPVGTMADSEELYRTGVILAAMVDVPRAPSMLRDLLFPIVVTTDADYVGVDYYRGSQRLAPFVSFFSKGSVVPREKMKSTVFKPPLVAPIKVMTGSDLHNRRPGSIDVAKDAEILVEDLRDLDERVSRREEWMCSNALFAGSVPINDWDTDRLLATLNYGKVYETLPSVPWTDPAASTPLEDIKACMREVSSNSIYLAETVVFGGQAASLFENNPSVQNMYNKYFIKVGELTPQQKEWGVTTLGTYRGIDLIANETSYQAKDGTTAYYVPPDYVLVAASTGKGKMSYAGVAQTNEEKTNLQMFEGTRIPHVWFPENSDVRKLRLASRPCPIVPPMENWCILKVT